MKHPPRRRAILASVVLPTLALVLATVGFVGVLYFTVAQRMREQPWGESMYLIAVTGWGQEEDKRQAKEAGFDFHYTHSPPPDQDEDARPPPAGFPASGRYRRRAPAVRPLRTPIARSGWRSARRPANGGCSRAASPSSRSGRPLNSRSMPLYFLLPAAGYLLMLLVESRDQDIDLEGSLRGIRCRGSNLRQRPA